MLKSPWRFVPIRATEDETELYKCSNTCAVSLDLGGTVVARNDWTREYCHPLSQYLLPDTVIPARLKWLIKYLRRPTRTSASTHIFSRPWQSFCFSAEDHCKWGYPFSARVKLAERCTAGVRCHFPGKFVDLFSVVLPKKSRMPSLWLDNNS